MGLAPEQVVNRVLGNKERRHRTSEWVLQTTEAMLRAHPHFREEAIEPQMTTIRGLVDIVEPDEHPADDWGKALVAAARAAEVERVVTDHPDLADKEEIDGVEFLSSDAWMIEQTTPPPPPPPPKKGLSFALTEPVAGETAVLVEVPHAGLAVPEVVRDSLTVPRDVLLRDSDIYVDKLYEGAPTFGATLLAATVSRYVVDLNRAPDDVDRHTVPDHPDPRGVQPRGVRLGA